MTEVSENLIVVKYGRESVTDVYGMNRERLEAHADHLDQIYEQYPKMIIVSSGSLAVGKAMLREKNLNPEAYDEQSICTLGSGPVVAAWQEALVSNEMLAAQLLVTHHEIDDDFGEGSVLLRTLRYNLSYGWVTVANENDALSKEELRAEKRGADNDRLAAHIATKLGAKALVFITGNPEIYGLHGIDNKLIRKVDRTNAEMAIKVAGESKNQGRGGMKSKVRNALYAAEHGIHAYIGRSDVSLKSILRGRAGTHFLPHS